MISSRLGILDSPLKSPTSLNGSMSLVPSTVSSPDKVPFIRKQKEPPSGSRDESPSAGKDKENAKVSSLERRPRPMAKVEQEFYSDRAPITSQKSVKAPHVKAKKLEKTQSMVSANDTSLKSDPTQVNIAVTIPTA